MKVRFIIITALILAGPAIAYDIDTGRQVGMGKTDLFSQPSALGFLSSPIGILAEGKIIVESGFQRKFELSDLDKVYLAAAYRRRKISIGIGVSQFGRSEYYVEQLLKSAVTYRYEFLALGMTVSGKRVEVGPSERKAVLRAASFGLACGGHYRKYHLGITIDNINRSRLADGGRPDNIIYNVFAEAEGPSDFSLTGRISFEKYEEPYIAMGQYIRIVDSNAIFWALSNNPLTYGGGVELHYSRFAIVYAASYHPVLGFTHDVSLRVSSGGLFR
jgi:hypothetical protein